MSMPRCRSSPRSGAVSISERVDTNPATVLARRTSDNSRKSAAARAASEARWAAESASLCSAMARRSARFSSLRESSAGCIAADVSFLPCHGRQTPGNKGPSPRWAAHQERGRRLGGSRLSVSASMSNATGQPDNRQTGGRSGRHYTRKRAEATSRGYSPCAPRDRRSISSACAIACAVFVVPPSMRAISSRRSSGDSTATSTVVRPLAEALVTLTW
jgi:hypothetical protein